MNRFYYSKALVRDYYKTLFLSMPQLAFLTVIFSALTLAALISSIISGNYLLLTAAVAAFAFVALFVALYLRSAVKKSLARFMAKQESGAPNSVYLLKERIVIEECDGAAHNLTYGELEKVLEGKSLYVLAAQNRRYVFLPKEGFVKGGAAEFFNFLKKNYPEIKLCVKKTFLINQEIE